MILLKDVPGLGRRHEVKEISPGYARNFLIPKKLAEFAAPGALARLERTAAVESAEDKIRGDLLGKNIESANGLTLTLKEKANDLGHLFAGIHKEELSQAIKKDLQLEIPAEYIVLDKPIKETGTFNLSIKGKEREATLTLAVEKL